VRLFLCRRNPVRDVKKGEDGVPVLIAVADDWQGFHGGDKFLVVHAASLRACATPTAITVAITLEATRPCFTLTVHAPRTGASGLKTARRKPRGFESLPLRRTNPVI
jgi:hypothetical protein